MSLSIKASQAAECLEPGCVAEGLNPDELVSVSEYHISLSIARSLKRIADSLELTHNSAGYSHTAADSLLGIMMNGRG